LDARGGKARLVLHKLLLLALCSRGHCSIGRRTRCVHILCVHILPLYILRHILVSAFQFLHRKQARKHLVIAGIRD
jgi:hypothetical protein